MIRPHVQYDRLSCGAQQDVDPDTGVEDPPGGGVRPPPSFLIGKRLLLGTACLPNAILQRGIDQQTPRHDHQERHDTLGLFDIDGRGQKLRVFEKAKAPFRQALTFVARQNFRSRQRGGIAFVGREDETTLGVEQALPIREGGGQRPLDPLHHFFWHGVGCWPPTFPVGGHGANRGPFEPRGLQVVWEGL